MISEGAMKLFLDDDEENEEVKQAKLILESNLGYMSKTTKEF